MRNYFEKLNIDKKTKKEHLFILAMICCFLFIIMCISGCNQNAAETCSTNSYDKGGITVNGCSIPGCGGCLSPEKGCGCALWAQSYKCVNGNVVDSKNHESFSMQACDTIYYADTCLGCAYEKRHDYFGFVNSITNNKENSASGCFNGSSKSGERFNGCINGKLSCINTEGEFEDMLLTAEQELGID